MANIDISGSDAFMDVVLPNINVLDASVPFRVQCKRCCTQIITTVLFKSSGTARRALTG
jgi:hypothetical protein